MKNTLEARSALGPLVLLAVVAGLVGAASRAASGLVSAPSDAEPAGPVAYEVPCPQGQLPDDGICVPATSPGELLHPDVHPEGASTAQDMLPVRADRPVDYARYALPLAAAGEGGARAALTVQDEASSEVGPAVRISAPGSAEVRSLRLEAQVDTTQVVFAAHGPPALLITAHRVARARGELVLLLVHSDLAEVKGALLEAMPSTPLAVEDGELLGRAGPSGILLGLRQLRRDVKLTDAVPDLAPDLVFASDVRNALRLAP